MYMCRTSTYFSYYLINDAERKTYIKRRTLDGISYLPVHYMIIDLGIFLQHFKENINNFSAGEEL